MTGLTEQPTTLVLSPTDLGRRILRNGTYNSRDAGGYPTLTEGVRMRTGMLFRADALAYLDDADLAEAERLGLRLIVDLRDPHERDNAPDLPVPGCENVSVMLFEGTLASFPAENYPTLPQLYDLLLHTHRARIIEVLARIAHTLPGPVLVHCTAGKDRTGIVIALLQTLAGVPLPTILADYSASEELLAGGFAARVEKVYLAAGVDLRKIGPEPIAAPSRYLGDALQGLVDEYGSIEEFLLGSGLSATSIERIRVHLTADAEAR